MPLPVDEEERLKRRKQLIIQGFVIPIPVGTSDARLTPTAPVQSRNQMPRPAAKIKTRLAAALLLCAGVGLALSALAARAQEDARARQAFRLTPPPGLPADAWRRLVPSTNPLTPEKVALGESLYFDKRLSADGTVSCATCHDAAAAFADRNVLAVGVGGGRGVRNAPTLLNVAFSESLFWDGRASSLEEQARQPLVNPSEMGMGSYDEVVARLAAIPEYGPAFRRAFPAEGITIDSVAKAIAAFERTQFSGGAPFDRFIAGDANALSESQKRGWGLFRGKAQCVACHAFSVASPFFTDFQFHNTGVGAQKVDLEALAKRAAQSAAKAGPDALSAMSHAEGFSELGRFLVTGRAKDTSAFKTPTLRDVELTAPYMHDGSAKTLLDVVRFYNKGGTPGPYLDDRMRPLNLSEEEVNDLVEFLRSLTSDDVLRQAQTTSPQTRTAVPLPAVRTGRR
jgi:cytochrome c peroxidase